MKTATLAAASALAVLAGINLAQTKPPAATQPALPYCVVDTMQSKCYDNRGEIAAPKPGQPFYGQDAQVSRHPASYTLGAGGRTVYDNNTGLTWQSSPDTNGDGALTIKDKLNFTQAQALPAKLNAAKFGGFDDWRLPTVKELYSLFDGRGTDPSGPTMSEVPGMRPFLDTKYFKFAYGSTRDGERIIDSQWATSSVYVANSNQMFGVNFADGRIKGYGKSMPGGRGDKTFFVLCVRGNPAYGKNDFHNNGDGTISDRATGLMWSKADSAKGLNWQDALAWVQKKNAEKYLGHDDWRMPSVKELHSILDYSRSPDTTQSAALDPLFECTQITNEGGKTDYPYYWSATTHGGFQGGAAAMYVAFGRASGWMSSQARPDSARGMGGPGMGGPGMGRPGMGRPGMDGPGMGGPGMGGPGQGGGAQSSGSGDYRFVDVHGAGAQRSDPKAGDPKQFPHGRGPQGDVIRIYNYVRCVRTETDARAGGQ